MFGEIAAAIRSVEPPALAGHRPAWRRRTVRLAPPARTRHGFSTCARARPTWPWPIGVPRAGGCGSSAATFAVRCSPSRRKKCRRAGAAGTIALVEADALQLPFADNRFDMVCVAFGLRNLSDPGRRPGGDGPRLPARRAVAVLEFSTPRRLAAWRPSTHWYFRRVLPRVGQTLARNHQSAYNYLPASVGEFPQGKAMAERMQAAGLDEVRIPPVHPRDRTLYVGRKAVDPSDHRETSL